MDRSEWEEPVDADAAPVYPAAPIPLHERSWRHPSELGATSAFVPPPAQELHRGVLIVTSLVGLACVIGLALVLLPGDPPSDPVVAGAGSTGLAEVAGTTLTLAARSPRWTGIDCDDQGDVVVVVSVAEGSPAAASGLERGDVILAVDGQPLDGMTGLAEMTERTPAGGKVQLTVRRLDAQHSVELWRPAGS